GGDRQPRSVDDAPGIARQPRTDAGDPAIGDRDVGQLAGTARAVDHQAAADQDVPFHVSLLFRARLLRRRAPRNGECWIETRCGIPGLPCPNLAPWLAPWRHFRYTLAPFGTPTQGA